MSSSRAYGYDEQLYVVPISIINHSGAQIRVYVGHEFVDYLESGERMVYNVSLFPNETVRVDIHARLGRYVSKTYTRFATFLGGVSPVVFTRESFFVRSVGPEARERIVSCMFANETMHVLDVFVDGKLIGSLLPDEVKAFRVPEGLVLIRSNRIDYAKFITRWAVESRILIIRDSDFW